MVGGDGNRCQTYSTASQRTPQILAPARSIVAPVHAPSAHVERVAVHIGIPIKCVARVTGAIASCEPRVVGTEEMSADRGARKQQRAGECEITWDKKAIASAGHAACICENRDERCDESRTIDVGRSYAERVRVTRESARLVGFRHGAEQRNCLTLPLTKGVAANAYNA